MATKGQVLHALRKAIRQADALSPEMAAAVAGADLTHPDGERCRGCTGAGPLLTCQYCRRRLCRSCCYLWRQQDDLCVCRECD